MKLQLTQMKFQIAAATEAGAKEEQAQSDDNGGALFEQYKEMAKEVYLKDKIIEAQEKEIEKLVKARLSQEMASLMKGLKRKVPKEAEKLVEEDPRLAEGADEIKRLKKTLSVYGEQLSHAEEELA
jgi:phosphate uptake regulator